MIKIIIHITKFIIATITALLFTSCNFNMNSIEGSGNVTTEKRIVQGEFKNVSVSNAIEVVIEQSDSTEIIVEADDNLQKEIITEVKNGTLIIKCKYSSFNDVTKKVTVKMPVVEKLEASSASSINSTKAILGEKLDLESSSASTIDINTESDSVICSASSGSTINVKGKALQLKTDASSGSTIDAKNLIANDVDADASSGASISINAKVSLKAEANSGASIDYEGSPKSLEKKSNSGGSIDQV